jgi:hypothetical protein
MGSNKHIDKSNVSNLLYKIYPDFKLVIKTEYDKVEQKLMYILTGRFAKFLLDQYRTDKSFDINKFALYIEDLLLYGDEYVQELAVIGFLEGIINIWGNNNADTGVVYNQLLPESKKWWDELLKFWNGEIRYVGESFEIN